MTAFMNVYLGRGGGKQRTSLGKKMRILPCNPTDAPTSRVGAD